MGMTQGSVILPRMNAHRLVIGAAAVTVAVAAAVTAALATFASQALPRAVRLDLARAPNRASPTPWRRLRPAPDRLRSGRLLRAG
jgi:hypothetical protein